MEPGFPFPTKKLLSAQPHILLSQKVLVVIVELVEASWAQWVLPDRLGSRHSSRAQVAGPAPFPWHLSGGTTQPSQCPVSSLPLPGGDSLMKTSIKLPMVYPETRLIYRHYFWMVINAKDYKSGAVKLQYLLTRDNRTFSALSAALSFFSKTPLSSWTDPLSTIEFDEFLSPFCQMKQK